MKFRSATLLLVGMATLGPGNARIIQERVFQGPKLALGQELSNDLVVTYVNDVPLNFVSSCKGLSTTVYEDQVSLDAKDASLFAFIWQKLKFLDWYIMDVLYRGINSSALTSFLFNKGIAAFGVFMAFIVYMFYRKRYGHEPILSFYTLNLRPDGKVYLEDNPIPKAVAKSLTFADDSSSLLVKKSALYNMSLEALQKNTEPDAKDFADEDDFKNCLVFAQGINRDLRLEATGVSPECDSSLRTLVWTAVKSVLFMELLLVLQHFIFQSMIVFYDRPTINESMKSLSGFFIYHLPHDSMMCFLVSNVATGLLFNFVTKTPSLTFWGSMVWCIVYYLMRRLIRDLPRFLGDHPFSTLCVLVVGVCLSMVFALSDLRDTVHDLKRSSFFAIDRINRYLCDPYTLLPTNYVFSERTLWYVQGLYTASLFVMPAEVVNLVCRIFSNGVHGNSKRFGGTRILISYLWNLLRQDFRVSAIPLVHSVVPRAYVSGLTSELSFIDENNYNGLPVFDNAFGSSLLLIIDLGQRVSSFTF